MKAFQTVVATLFFVAIIMMLSLFSEKIWNEKSIKIPPADSLKISSSMTIKEFGETNKIPNKLLFKIFDIKDKTDLNNNLLSKLNLEQIRKKYKKQVALFSENAKKNMKKILIKFILWIIFVWIAVKNLKNYKMTAKKRVAFYAIGIVVFGILFGSDPSPMGTIKDAIVLYGTSKVFFLPRFIALLVFLSFVVIANKSICAWGCQLGVLQDFIYRLGKDTKENSVIKQYKIPFVITNSIRIIFFILIVLFAFLWTFDLVHPIDPFKIYHPSVLTIVGISFIAIITILSVFTYRPWCNLFCPFGLVGWIFEKFSFLKIKVNYNKCIACGKCENACPTFVMSAILRRDKKTIPDCFSCGACMNVCPTKAISFEKGKRELPPDKILEKLQKLNKKREKK